MIKSYIKGKKKLIWQILPWLNFNQYDFQKFVK